MKLLAIDGNSILHRAFYGVKPALSSKNGVPTNAVFGFMNIYLKNLKDVNPDAIAVAFDRSEPTVRHDAVATYKANRHGMPDELAQQLEIVKKLLSLMGVKVIDYAGYEADDILGTLARTCSENGNQCFILTGDRDSLQLVDENVTVLLTTNKGIIKYTPEKFVEDYGFQPVNIIDLKALMGDSSDNISGVAGIGQKTASELVKEFATIENLYEKYQDSGIKNGVKTKLENGKESAYQSKWLATICRDVPIDTVMTNYIPHNPDNEKLYECLSELEMSTIINKLGLIMPEKSIEVTIQPLTTEIIQSLKECIYTFENGILYVLCGNMVYTASESEIITDFLASPCEKITDNAKPHYRYAMEKGSTVNNLKDDISIIGYLLNVNGNEYSIKSLCSEYGVHYYSENEKFADILSMPELLTKIKFLIKAENLMFLYENVEIPLIEVLASMENTGIKVDEKGVEKFGKHLSIMIEETKKKIFDRAGYEFNISSTKQLGKVLFDEMQLQVVKKTKTGYSTNADVLDILRDKDPVIKDIIDFRQYAKLKSTYIDGILKKISTDGRIHTSFRQTETRTGRISSTEPNMQNIPVRTELGRQMRKFFIADTGKILIDADYSQIELRVMAHLCGDKNLTKAFNTGEDIHTLTASQVFDVPPVMVSTEMRSTAKAVNFGIIYGMGAFSLSKNINITREQAEKYINSYLERYPKVRKFMEDTVEKATETGFVKTLFGRKRRIPEIKSSNRIQQATGKRIAMNTPVQGTSADLIKIAMINVYNRLKTENIDAKLILQVHDELIIEADVSCIESAVNILREEMQNVYEMKVPLVVDISTGNSWYEAKE